MSKKMNKRAFKKLKWGLVFILPWLIGFCFLTLYPLLSSVYYSFTDFGFFSSPQWIGIDNFVKLKEDPLFWVSLKNTGWFLGVGVPLCVLLSLFIAILLNYSFHGRSFFRAIFFLPVMIPIVVASIVWAWILNPDYGLINSLLGYFGIKGPGWLGSVTWSKPAILLMLMWAQGQAIVIFLAGLQEVPRFLYESADLEGASGFQKFIHITLPLITPTILLNTVMAVINISQIFTQPYIMTGGGPANSTLTVALYIYNNAFAYYNLGYACAFSWILFAIIFAVTLLVFRSSKKWVFYQM